ncbi:hypothetical protein KFK09_025770 [Dendrobium nobile]|uniref:Chromo domain-containing protein n=1 Tax=Dendrobium nobile TaxID=94219 RepID=A0A8T3A5J8_DENNO|nr:hypothetical protein KFK09_025770 [Dendrobium nobile]
MSPRTRTSEFAFAFAFASHLHELHNEIKKKIEQSNTDYKINADKKRRFKEFKVGDFVMVRIRPERFPPGSVKKLHARSVGPFKILAKVNNNAYVLELPEGFNMNPTFNIGDIVAFEGPDFNPNNPLHNELYVTPPGEIPGLPPLPNLPHLPRAEKIETILDDEIISTKDGGRQRYLVHWEGTPETEDTWIDREELQRLDPDLLELYESFHSTHSTESSSLPPGENDEDIDRRFRRVYQRRPRRSTAMIESLYY